MTQTKEFMLVFRYDPTNQVQTEDELQEISKQWGPFIGGIAMQGNLISTHQLGYTGKVISSDKSTSDGFHIAEGMTLGGNLILKADSYEIATETAKKCPILLMGGSIEVREIIPMN
jgi:hypothetical protein